MKNLKRKIIILASTCLLTVFTINTAGAQPPHAKAHGKHKFYYYPASNVYYDAGPRLYYYNSGASWTGVTVLPPTFSITIGAPRYVVYHDGPEVWQNNSVHVVKYKAYKNKPGKHKNHKKQGKH
jgi:hypothetical protein